MIVGFGENSVDHVYRLPAYPQPGTASSKLQIARHDIRGGGQVATTMAACAALGLPARYVGAFGNDDNADRIRRELDRRGVETSQAVVRQAPNRHAVILVDSRHGERVVLWQKDPRLAIVSTDVRPEWLAGATWVHVDATDADAAITLARMARDGGLPVSCDVDADTPAARELIDAVTVPILAEQLPHDITGETDLERALRALRRPHHTHVVVTLGARGAAMLSADRVTTEPGVVVDVVDTTGAGDVFRGAFIVAMTQRNTPGQTLRFANAAAALACTRDGAIDGVPTPDEAYGLQAQGFGPGQRSSP
jgi:sugar/nucleoside kinase (ribokinase family)